ncbi:unnamed protein product [Citrullus colocynthis]|uniref:Uncharacterized protein n=1 Tax=Citrullus colocynthis TaxID=252529 RepID=A0ABP0Z4I9_9ROSI
MQKTLIWKLTVVRRTRRCRRNMVGVTISQLKKNQERESDDRSGEKVKLKLKFGIADLKTGSLLFLKVIAKFSTIKILEMEKEND